MKYEIDSLIIEDNHDSRYLTLGLKTVLKLTIILLQLPLCDRNKPAHRMGAAQARRHSREQKIHLRVT